MKNKQLFKFAVIGIIVGLIILIVKDSLEAKIAASLSIIIFIYILFNSFDFFKKKKKL